MIGPIVRHPRIVVILEVDCSNEDGPVPRDHFIQAVRLEGDMMQRGFDDRHCWPPKTFSIAHRNRYRGSPLTAGSRALLVNFRSNRCARGKVPWMECPLGSKPGHFGVPERCPLYPQKRTLALSRVMLCAKSGLMQCSKKILRRALHPRDG